MKPRKLKKVMSKNTYTKRGIRNYQNNMNIALIGSESYDGDRDWETYHNLF